MDFVKNLTGNGNNNDSKIGQAPIPTGDVSRAQSGEAGGFLGGLGERFNSAAGGGAEGEKREDLLDKGMFYLSV